MKLTLSQKLPEFCALKLFKRCPFQLPGIFQFVLIINNPACGSHSAHSDPVQVDATQDEIDLIAKATGIQSSAIKLVCYERPQFVESQKKGFGLTDILQILLAVLIFALLGYVVFRSTRKQKVEEPEPELSVDAPAGGYFR